MSLKEITKPIRLNNRRCIYCNGDFPSKKSRRREHVIARRFVPKGTLKANDWNLIVWACERCNFAKGKLEEEISAISLQPAIGSNHTDPNLSSLAERKASIARSEATGKTVRDSRQRATYTHHFGPGASMTFGFIAPPQLVRQRVEALATAHIHAFFYSITYDESLGHGSGLPGGVAWLDYTHKPDWGNARFRAFASLTEDWHARVRGIAAEGFFRVAIKRDPSGIELWSFALEWNQNYRVIGFFGDTAAAQSHVVELSSSQTMQVDETTRIREEVRLDASEDVLFTCFFED